jgi:hypothetical protein
MDLMVGEGLNSNGITSRSKRRQEFDLKTGFRICQISRTRSGTVAGVKSRQPTNSRFSVSSGQRRRLNHEGNQSTRGNAHKAEAQSCASISI